LGERPYQGINAVRRIPRCDPIDLIFHSKSRQLLGVHIIGEGASELIHIGQAVLSFGGKIDYFIDTVFNYPTLAECYKVAAFHGINRLGIFEPEKAEPAEGIVATSS
jgi:NAD(P) transhydrogenase